MTLCMINADDFGLSPGVCRGIVQALENGVVTAATAMVCVPGACEAIPRYLPPLKGKLGLHLQLTKGTPCLPPEEIPSLVNATGRFPDSAKELGELDSEEVLREFRAQVNRLREFGTEPSHLDAHHHIHKLPAVFPAYCRLALEIGLPARGLGPAHTIALRQQGIPTADMLLVSWFKHDLTPEALLRMLQSAMDSLPLSSQASGHNGGVIELMTHPGHADTALMAVSSYTSHRELELQCLCSRELREGIEQMGLTLAGPEALQRTRPQTA